jgi:hypothetical protein
VRLEAVAQFLVNAGARAGVTPYGGTGMAYAGAPRRRGVVAMMLFVGVEAAAGRPRGWFGEVGLGGGVRVRAGYRWRRLAAWWP